MRTGSVPAHADADARRVLAQHIAASVRSAKKASTDPEEPPRPKGWVWTVTRKSRSGNAYHMRRWCPRIKNSPRARLRERIHSVLAGATPCPWCAV